MMNSQSVVEALCPAGAGEPCEEVSKVTPLTEEAFKIQFTGSRAVRTTSMLPTDSTDVNSWSALAHQVTRLVLERVHKRCFCERRAAGARPACGKAPEQTSRLASSARLHESRRASSMV